MTKFFFSDNGYDLAKEINDYAFNEGMAIVHIGYSANREVSYFSALVVFERVLGD